MVKCLYASQPANLFQVVGAAGGREKYETELNETNSLGDLVFGALRERPAQLPKGEFLQLKDWKQLVDKTRDSIAQHIDRRVALFFQQLVVCYDVPFHFEIGETQHQAQSAPTLKKKCGKEEVSIPFNSAHSSTIPCLFAYPKREWNRWDAKKGEPNPPQKPTGFVYLKGSDTYNYHNSTLEMIKLVNMADISLDGTKQSLDQLRVKSIKILNEASDGKLAPDQALQSFLRAARKIMADKATDRSVSEKTRYILSIYRDCLDEVIEESQEEEFFDRLLNVRIDDETERASDLRKVIYRRRYDIIRRSQEAQSVIMKKIAGVRAQILGIERKPPGFEKVFRKKIFTLCTSGQERKQMQKLFNISLAQLEHDLQGKNYRSATNKVEDTRWSQAFATMMRDIRAECRSLTGQEFTFRSQVSRDLRTFKGWRQVDVAAKYKEKYPRYPMSQPTLSRVENTIKKIDMTLAGHLADLFEVDKGLFFPALFTSQD